MEVRLTPVESMFAADNRVAYPMTSFLRFVFDEALDDERLRSAVRKATSNQPLLKSILLNKKRGQYFWRTTGADPPVVIGAQAPLNRCFRLEEQTGIAVYVSENTVDVAWHHAISDGVGILAWFGDVLRAYGEFPLRELDPTKLSDRATLHRTRSIKESVARLGCDLKNSCSLLAVSPISLPPAAIPDYAFTELGPVDLQELHRLAKQRGTSLNPVIVSAVYDTIVLYLLERAPENLSQGAVRIALPVNCRSAKDRTMPAANKLAYSFLSFRPKGDFYEDVWEPVPLWARCEFHEFMRNAMRQRLFEGLWWKLAVLARCSQLSLPFNWQSVFNSTRCYATAVLTDNGDPTRSWRLPSTGGLVRSGGITLLQITGAAPLRPGTELAISAFTYGGTLRLGLLSSLGSERLQSLRTLLQVQCLTMAMSAALA